ncbi:hypothetical protein [Paenibacillus harenae]|uniref:hypothetical protein n=1 Tax=Paenibacillus harenae TaxID=306543 RepID=UPI0003F789EA|nr:hypothetical protein [Paenibacillus harenae]
MRINRAIAAIIMLAVCIVPLLGCGSTGKRTPEEWLTLSYSGLAATDQYAFTGSMSMKTADGVEFKPQIFEGKVVDHQQLTLQTNSEDPLHWNPVQVLGALNEKNEEVRIENGNDDKKTVTLHIKESKAAAKTKWEQRLRLQLDQLGANAPASDSAYKAEWEQELGRSRKQLDAMLSTMEAETEYKLVIDRDRLLPLKMDEKTIFHFIHNGYKVSEERDTTVRFQSFDGSSSQTVQEALSHVTMDLLSSDSLKERN